ncbi:MAG: hypothetical protein GY723_20065 [bacterium]|nr:hypothetical protein [bacterium]
MAFDVEYRVLEEGLALAFFTDESGTLWELTEGLDCLAKNADEPGGTVKRFAKAIGDLQLARKLFGDKQEITWL